jgi:hypothetical protein
LIAGQRGERPQQAAFSLLDYLRRPVRLLNPSSADFAGAFFDVAASKTSSSNSRKATPTTPAAAPDMKALVDRTNAHFQATGGKRCLFHNMHSREIKKFGAYNTELRDGAVWKKDALHVDPVELSRVLSIGQQMHRGCGVSFHQQRT